MDLLSDLPYAQACEWIEAAKAVLLERPDTAEEKPIAQHNSIGEREAFAKVNLEVSGQIKLSVTMAPLGGRCTGRALHDTDTNEIMH